MKLTGGQIIAKSLKDYGVKHVAAIPGHGCWAMLDAFAFKVRCARVTISLIS